MIYILSILVFILSISLYFLFKFALIIIDFEETIESSLTIIEERHESISKVLEIPLFYDSKEVRSVLNDIEVTRDVLINISNQLNKKEKYVDERDEREGREEREEKEEKT